MHDELEENTIVEAEALPANTALAPVSAANEVAASFVSSQEDLQALKEVLAKSGTTLTDAQFRVFVVAANHLGLDPLARQVVPIVQGGRMTVQTTIDGFRLIAERTRKYRGQLGPFWCGPDGEWREVWLADGAPAAAKVGVLRADFTQPMWGVARFKSYTKAGNTWSAMPDVMIAKVAESLALRKAFPAELSGAYTREELAASLADIDDGGALIETPVEPAPQRTPATHKSANANAASAWSAESDPDIKRGLIALRYVSTSAQRDELATLHKRFAADGLDWEREAILEHLRDRYKAAAKQAARGRRSEQAAQPEAPIEHDLRNLPASAGAH